MREDTCKSWSENQISPEYVGYSRNSYLDHHLSLHWTLHVHNMMVPKLNQEVFDQFFGPTQIIE